MMENTNMNRRSYVRTLLLVVMGAVFGIVAACSGGTSSEPRNSDIAEAVAGDEGSSCLGEYADKLCELLTEEMVRSQFPEMPEDVEPESRTSGFNMCRYAWPGPRMGSREIGGMVVEYELKDVVEIKFLKVLRRDDPLATFRNSYHTLTPEEKKRAAEAFREGMDKKVKDEELSKEGGEIGEAMGTGLLDNLRYESVDGVGTAAAWGGSGGQLSLQVLHRDTKFEVLVDVYEEETRNREAAVALALQVVAVCD